MESVKQPIVNIILEVLSATPPVFVDGKTDFPKARLAAQLIDSGHLKGVVGRSSQGIPFQVTIIDVTTDGRRLCQQLEDEIRDARFSVRAGKTIKKGTILLLSGACGVIGGVIGAVVTEIVLRKTGLK